MLNPDMTMTDIHGKQYARFGEREGSWVVLHVECHYNDGEKWRGDCRLRDDIEEGGVRVVMNRFDADNRGETYFWSDYPVWDVWAELFRYFSTEKIPQIVRDYINDNYAPE